MWSILNAIDSENNVIDEPSDDEFYEYFKNECDEQTLVLMSDNYEQEARAFLDRYDKTGVTNFDSEIETYMINMNFSEDEISSAIDTLKSSKSPGLDAIPAEFIKNCKDILARDITTIVNYIIEERNFPDMWAEGLRSAVFKSGKRSLVNNYRGITILPIIEKVFEVAVYRRMSFANEAMGKIDKYNGGFINGSRTSDNIFILNGLIQRQLILGQSLFVCFVDFSKAFDLVNRHILFFKIMKEGWHGRVIDTLRNLYTKTHFRVKRNGKLSAPIASTLRVNQGGVASGLLFRKHLKDLDDYLKKDAGVCINETIIAHLLWADDLILFSDTEKGIQKQLDGLKKFCENNRMIVNETKTKVMTFGKKNNCNVYFNDKQIEQVVEYKYLGNIVKSVRTDKQDIFSPNYTYLRDRANRAIFLVSRKLRNIEHPPPKIMFDIFDTLIMPILVYGSDVCSNKDSIDILDKVFLRFIRCTLGIKATTSNIIVAGECGRLPPSTQCILHTLCYVNRMIHMNGTSLVKQVYDERNDLREQGFNTWVTSLHNLADEYQIDLSLEPDDFHRICKSSVRTKYIEQWSSCMMQFDRFPLLRTYRGIKLEFKTEPYLYLVKNRRFRHAKGGGILNPKRLSMKEYVSFVNVLKMSYILLLHVL